MDVSGINWAYVALAIVAVLLIVWIFRLKAARPAWLAGIVSFALLVLAGFNAAAPWRGLIDPNYIGYGFGYLSASHGWEVTAVAGSVFVLATAGAFAALERGRTAMIVTALACLLFTVNVGGPWLTSALTDIEANRIQFGEYLTIPGPIGTALMFVLFVLPFSAGTVWAGRRSLNA